MSYSDDMTMVRGTRIRMLRGGKGPPLIFLHGASGHVGWLPFLDRLSQSFDVLAPEHPGFGGSDDPSWLDQTCDLAYFYLDLMEALDLDCVHLMGTSLRRGPAAERCAHQMNTVEIQRLHQVEIEVGKIAGLIEPGRIVRATESRMLGGEHIETLRQSIEERQPPDMTARAVEEDQRRSLSAPEHADARAAHHGHVVGIRHRSANR